MFRAAGFRFSSSEWIAPKSLSLSSTLLRLLPQFEEAAPSYASRPERSSTSPVPLGEERMEIDIAAVMARLAAERAAQEAHTQDNRPDPA